MIGKRELALAAASIVATALLAEIGLRIAGISYPIVHQMEPLRGWAPLPGVSGVWRAEGDAHVSFNREGFRDRDHTVTKPANTFRIAVLGDSMTEALAVPVTETYWSVIERTLARCDGLRGKTVEVLNFGVSGYGPAQERRTLQHNALKYGPDLILLALFTGNDILNSERALDGHKDRVYYVMEDGVLVLDDSNTRAGRFKWKRFWRTVRNTLINASNLFQVIREGSTRLRNMMRDAPPAGTVFVATGREYEVFAEPRSAEWRRAWTVTEALISAIRGDSAAGGAAFLLALLPGPVQVYPDPAIRRNVAESLGVAGLDYADKRLESFARRNDIPAIVLSDPLRQYADRTGTYLHGFPNTRPGTGHWNADGHRIAGETLARTICDRVP